jgi:fructuronate reductase
MLQALEARGVQVPAYRHARAPGVVHLGLGAFHRAHQALVFDDLLGAGDSRWGVHGVAMHNPAVADALAAQDRLYALRLASARAVRWRVCGAISRTSVAAQNRSEVVAAIASPNTRWVTLTVTEKAYGPELAGLLIDGLALRQQARLPGLTLACCDNLLANGRQLQALCVDEADRRGASLAAWLQQACAFPCSMVDRIVPASSPDTLQAAEQALGVDDRVALRTEAFWEWVIERRFADPSDAVALESAGVRVVDDVAAFEEAKLRLLNGSHSAMACVGAVAGLPVISDCIARPEIRDYVHGLMSHEVGPLLRRSDWPHYRDALIERFSNPSLQHSVHQIAIDSSKKISQRWIPAAQDALAQGRSVDRLAFAAAAWMRYCQGADDAGHTYALSDPLADSLLSAARSHQGDIRGSFDALGRNPAIWGKHLPDHRGWRMQVEAHLASIQSGGMLAALSRLAPPSPSH